MIAPRRPLDDMLVELMDGVRQSGSLRPTDLDQVGVAASSVEFDLPVETVIEHRDGDWVVLADSPRTRMRSDFDVPVSRLVATIVTGYVA